MEEFPNNSHTPKPTRRQAEEETRRVKKVVTGEVVQKKKSPGRRFTETFFGGDAQGVVSYIMLDVAIPAAKDMLYDMVSQGVERTLFGEVRTSSRRTGIRPGSVNGYTPYHSMSRRPSRDEPRREIGRRARATHDFRDIVLGTRREADLVLEGLDELIERYQSATVADLYDLCDIDRVYTDTKHGWLDLRDARVKRVHDGFLLDLPRPEPLD